MSARDDLLALNSDASYLLQRLNERSYDIAGHYRGVRSRRELATPSLGFGWLMHETIRQLKYYGFIHVWRGGEITLTSKYLKAERDDA